jgi:hypothetical protein
VAACVLAQGNGKAHDEDVEASGNFNSIQLLQALAASGREHLQSLF